LNEEGSAGSRWLLLGAFVPLAVMVDQVTKQVAEGALAGRPFITVIDGLFMFRYSRNKGAFFSIGEHLPDDLRKGLFVVATAAAAALMVNLYRRAAEGQRVFRWALLALLAGAFGNLVDRLLYGEVIDFLHLHFRDHFHWATFNVADIYICIGLVLLAIDLWRPSTSEGPETSRAT